MKWLTRLSILAVFILGAVVGAPIGMKIERERFQKMERNGPAALIENALRRISDEVKLNAQQKDQMRTVLQNVEPEIVNAEQERQEKIIGILEKVRNKASSFLSEEQKQRYTAFHERIKSKLAPAASAAAAAAAAFLNNNNR